MAAEGRIPGVNESVNWIFRQPNWVRAYVIGAVLGLIPIVFFMPLGYGLLVMRDSLRGEAPRLRDWDNLWGETFVLGFKATALMLLYEIPAFALILFLIALKSWAAALGLGFLVLVLVGVLAPLAISRMLIEDSFGAGLALTEVWDHLQHADRSYFLAVALTVGVYLVFGIVAQVPFLGFLVAVAAGFGLTLWMGVLWGTVCRPIMSPPPGPLASGPITRA